MADIAYLLLRYAISDEKLPSVIRSEVKNLKNDFFKERFFACGSE